MICTESRHHAGFRCVKDQIFPRFASIFRLCHTSLLNLVSEQKILRASKCVPLIASIQQKKVSITKRLINFISIQKLASIVVCVLMSVQCKQFFQKTICLPNGTSTSKSMQTGSKKKKSENFFWPLKLTQNQFLKRSKLCGLGATIPPHSNQSLRIHRRLVDPTD